ncbi:major histocompatibility complex class I-related gene protein-like isoform X2 [Perca fluviatilis]|nr:major histocompatibility complex class I-related gene protein-like isoform X2 [Perca fluviatilis]
MKTFMLLLLFCHVSSPVKHSFKILLTGSSGLPNFPEFVGATVVDEVLVGYSTPRKDTRMQTGLGENLFENNPQQLEFYTERCSETEPNTFKARIDNFKQHFNQSGGVHILQRMNGCEWDIETGEVSGFDQYGYDGEDLLAFDLNTSTWIALKPQAVIIKQRWDADKSTIKHIKILLTQICPEWLKMYLDYSKRFLLRKAACCREGNSNMFILIAAGVAVLVVLAVYIAAATGFNFYKNKKTKLPPQ